MFEWDAIADYYDLVFDHTDDILFWQKLTQQYGSPVLELSCGNGRLTFPIAENGTTIVGIDIAKDMLAKGAKKLKRLPKNIQKRISLIHADEILFNLHKKFRTIICPSHFWPITETEQNNFFESMKRHLQPDGHLIIDINNVLEPTEDWNIHKIKTFKQLPKLGFTLVRETFVHGSAKTKIARIIHFLDRVYPNGTIKRIVTERKERHYTQQDMISLLNQHGFTVIKTYGDYQFGRWSENSRRNILVAKRSIDLSLLSKLTLLFSRI